MVVKKKFRTMYDTQSYDDREKGGGVSLTDESQYEPIEEKLRRFGVGEIIPGAASESFELEGDPMDDNHNTESFEHGEAIESNAARLAKMGEEAIAKEHVQLKRKIDKAKQEKAMKDSKARSEAFAKKVREIKQEVVPVVPGKENIEKGKA